MKLSLHTLAAMLLITSATQAQLISKFNWDGTNPSQALYGPNATSISTYAVTSSGGVGGTSGLNPGSGSHDINLVLPGSYYTLPGLDISIDFRRKESDASFFTIGNFDFGMAGGSLYAKFALVKGTGDTMINATGLYSIPSDNAFHTYHFIYNASTGTAIVTVDGTTVYTYTRTPAAALYWTGAGDATVGKIMDATGSNVAILDNLIVQVPGTVTLPLSLTAFDAAKNGSYVNLDWTTTKELNTRSIVVERATADADFEAIDTLAAKQSYSGDNSYHFTDSMPAAKNNYRLKFIDLDGAYTYSAVKSLTFTSTTSATISCFPNPFVDYVNIRIAGGTASAGYTWSVTTVDGRTIQSGKTTVDGSFGQVSLNLSAATKGMYIIRLQNIQNNSTETFKVVRK